MKQRAPSPEPQSSSEGLRVVIGQNSWNKVGFKAGFWAAASDTGADTSWLSESDCGAAELVCGGDMGKADVVTSGCFSSAFWRFGISRGPRTFRWELQNSVQQNTCFGNF